jgi:YD repeat-containing protein
MLTAQYGFVAANESAAMLNSRIIHVSKTYDNLGRVIEASEPYFATLGSFQSCGIGTSGVPCTKTTFDFAGRSLIVTLPDGTFTTTNYETLPQCDSTGGSCLKRTVINAKLQETVEVRNILGELLRTTDAQGLSMSHSYDVYGNLVSSARQSSNGDGAGLEIVNSAVFDILGRRVSMTDPDTGTSTSNYNAIGEVLTSTDANGFCIRSTYDAVGRVVSSSDYRDPNCSGAVESTSSFVFDVANNGLGMLAQESSVSGPAMSGASTVTRSQQYDSLGRIVRLETSIDGQSFAQESSYDQFGRKFQDFDLVFDAGTPDAISASEARRLGAQYDYNGQGYQYRIRNAAGTASDIFYEVLKINARGQVEQSKRGNRTEMVSNIEWDPIMGRLNAISSGNNTGTGNDGALQNLRYDDANGDGYDEIGNLTYRLDARRNLRESFGYDNMNRLTSSALARNGQSVGAQSFVYDQLGNFLFKASERQRTGGY